MANEEVLGPRKTMFVLVIVVGCFAVLWPRILSPLILGHTQEQLKPNKFDREAGCCEVLFEPQMAVLELINEVCSSVISDDGKLSPYAAAECRKSVNETCGVDIVAFLKRNENVGKTTKMILETMKSSNSSCLKEHFGVPTWSLSTHTAVNSWTMQDTLKQERPPIRGAAPHPALRERGRAIPAGTPAPPSKNPVPLPPHVRVRSSPLSVYFELDIKPPPIPGMRPPLGSPGGPVAAPKSSMGFVMPIYTICIIVFFVYTLSKILFKRTGTVPYDSVSPDPQFRRRVFRDDSRTSPDKLVVTAISGLVAEVQQQMDASYAQSQQRQEVQDNHTRPYTNGTILHNSGPVHIVASEYREASKEKSPEPQKEKEPEVKEPTPEPKESTPEPKEATPEPKESTPEPKENAPQPKEPTPEPKESSPESDEVEPEESEKPKTPESEEITVDTKTPNTDLIKLTESIVEEKTDPVKKATEEFLENAKVENVLATSEDKSVKQSTPELLEEALKEDSPVKKLEVESEEEVEVEEEEEEVEEEEEEDDVVEPENASVKHEAEDVKSIFLETEIPQQSRVLVADFAEKTADRTAPTKHSPMVVSGKMTLSLIQDAPRDTPERDPESTVDDFTTASAVTQPAAEKEELSDEEVEEEEIEIEEIEEEVEEIEEEEEEEEAPKAEPKTVAKKV